MYVADSYVNLVEGVECGRHFPFGDLDDVRVKSQGSNPSAIPGTLILGSTGSGNSFQTPWSSPSASLRWAEAVGGTSGFLLLSLARVWSHGHLDLHSLLGK